jgi:hypothetical protein
MGALPADTMSVKHGIRPERISATAAARQRDRVSIRQIDVPPDGSVSINLGTTGKREDPAERALLKRRMRKDKKVHTNSW